MSLVQNKGAVGEEKQSIRRAAPADSPEDREIPTYVRKGSGVSREEGQFTRPQEQRQEPEEFVFDEDDREIPSFIRKQAD